MKIKDRYKLLNHAKEEYNKTFNLNLQFKHLSKNKLHNLLKEYKHSNMCEWSFCCYGLEQCCWQELVEEGNWGLTQERVDECIKYAIDLTAKACRRDNRILYYERDNAIDVFIITRDIYSTDFLITFTNETR